MQIVAHIKKYYIDGLVQERRNSSVLALALIYRYVDNESGP